MMSKQNKPEQTASVAVSEDNKYRYVCPACTSTAFESTNKMLGVSVVCKHCGTTILVKNEASYIAL